jgi:hypothetical protein
MAAVEKSVSFNHDEKLALQQIVRDWLHEELIVPPFEPSVAAVLQKLGLDEEEPRAAIGPGRPKTQEVLSEPRKQAK